MVCLYDDSLTLVAFLVKTIHIFHKLCEFLLEYLLTVPRMVNCTFDLDKKFLESNSDPGSFFHQFNERLILLLLKLLLPPLTKTVLFGFWWRNIMAVLIPVKERMYEKSPYLWHTYNIQACTAVSHFCLCH